MSAAAPATESGGTLAAASMMEVASVFPSSGSSGAAATEATTSYATELPFMHEVVDATPVYRMSDDDGAWVFVSDYGSDLFGDWFFVV